ncbi:MAG: radical SAM protein [Deltaproteobacteria bacterium]|nr:radical SAM protein [Deltaproteobacteria bacterium]
MTYDEYQRVTQLFDAPWAGENPVPVRTVHLDVSNRCNEQCPICYYPDTRSAPEMTLSEIEDVANRYRGRAVVLGGREPTMREDLDDIIRVIAPHCSTLLLTNGFELDKPGYLESLCQAGLDGVILSFNGVSDEAYVALGGKACFERKMGAFRALKEARFPTIVSMTVAKGINTDHVRPVLELCRQHTDFVRELRLRALRPLGRCAGSDHEQLEMRDLIELVTAPLDTTLKDLSRGIAFWHEMGNAFDVDSYRPQACTLEFMTRRIEGKWICEGELVSQAALEAVTRWKQRSWYRYAAAPALLGQLFRIYGWRPIFRRLWHLRGRWSSCTTPSFRARLDAVRGQNDLLQITLKSWPLAERYTESEQHKCATLFVSKNETCRFCERNIRHSKRKAG